MADRPSSPGDADSESIVVELVTSLPSADNAPTSPKNAESSSSSRASQAAAASTSEAKFDVEDAPRPPEEPVKHGADDSTQSPGAQFPNNESAHTDGEDAASAPIVPANDKDLGTGAPDETPLSQPRSNPQNLDAATASAEAGDSTTTSNAESLEAANSAAEGASATPGPASPRGRDEDAPVASGPPSRASSAIHSSPAATTNTPPVLISPMVGFSPCPVGRSGLTSLCGWYPRPQDLSLAELSRNVVVFCDVFETSSKDEGDPKAKEDRETSFRRCFGHARSNHAFFEAAQLPEQPTRAAYPPGLVRLEWISASIGDVDQRWSRLLPHIGVSAVVGLVHCPSLTSSLSSVFAHFRTWVDMEYDGVLVVRLCVLNPSEDQMRESNLDSLVSSGLVIVRDGDAAAESGDDFSGMTARLAREIVARRVSRVNELDDVTAEPLRLLPASSSVALPRLRSAASSSSTVPVVLPANLAAATTASTSPPLAVEWMKHPLVRKLGYDSSYPGDGAFPAYDATASASARRASLKRLLFRLSVYASHQLLLAGFPSEAYFRAKVGLGEYLIKDADVAWEAMSHQLLGASRANAALDGWSLDTASGNPTPNDTAASILAPLDAALALLAKNLSGKGTPQYNATLRRLHSEATIRAVHVVLSTNYTSTYSKSKVAMDYCARNSALLRNHAFGTPDALEDAFALVGEACAWSQHESLVPNEYRRLSMTRLVQAGTLLMTSSSSSPDANKNALALFEECCTMLNSTNVVSRPSLDRRESVKGKQVETWIDADLLERCVAVARASGDHDAYLWYASQLLPLLVEQNWRRVEDARRDILALIKTMDDVSKGRRQVTYTPGVSRSVLNVARVRALPLLESPPGWSKEPLSWLGPRAGLVELNHDAREAELETYLPSREPTKVYWIPGESARVVVEMEVSTLLLPVLENEAVDKKPDPAEAQTISLKMEDETEDADRQLDEQNALIHVHTRAALLASGAELAASHAVIHLEANPTAAFRRRRKTPQRRVLWVIGPFTVPHMSAQGGGGFSLQLDMLGTRTVIPLDPSSYVLLERPQPLLRIVREESDDARVVLENVGGADATLSLPCSVTAHVGAGEKLTLETETMGDVWYAPAPSSQASPTDASPPVSRLLRTPWPVVHSCRVVRADTDEYFAGVNEDEPFDESKDEYYDSARLLVTVRVFEAESLAVTALTDQQQQPAPLRGEWSSSGKHKQADRSLSFVDPLKRREDPKEHRVPCGFPVTANSAVPLYRRVNLVPGVTAHRVGWGTSGKILLASSAPPDWVYRTRLSLSSPSVVAPEFVGLRAEFQGAPAPKGLRCEFFVVREADMKQASKSTRKEGNRPDAWWIGSPNFEVADDATTEYAAGVTVATPGVYWCAWKGWMPPNTRISWWLARPVRLHVLPNLLLS